MAIVVAVDAMGGDRAPEVVIEGAVRAARSGQGRITVLLVGPEDRLRTMLDGQDVPEGSLRLLDAPQVIGMDEAPAQAMKTKTNSSIHVGLKAHKEGGAQAFVSAGNTGAVMAASLFVLGRLPGVSRPSLVGFFPTTKRYSLVLDVGANVDCKPEHLVQFAHMGNVYARRLMHVEQPRVALMNIGEEPGKGNELAKAAFALLEKTDGLHFAGNIEGRDLLHHAADVVICDGFVGNIMLKEGESLATAMMEMVRDEMKAQQLSPEQQQLVAKVLAGVKQRFNYEEYGGAPLLGVAGNVMIGHGGSTPRAIEQLINKAAEMVEQRVAEAIEASFRT